MTLLTADDRITVKGIPALLAPWARWLGRPEPKQKLIANWAWRGQADWPDPVSDAQPVDDLGRPCGRPAREYLVIDVLVWYLEYMPKSGRHHWTR